MDLIDFMYSKWLNSDAKYTHRNTVIHTRVHTCHQRKYIAEINVKNELARRREVCISFGNKSYAHITTHTNTHTTSIQIENRDYLTHFLDSNAINDEN